MKTFYCHAHNDDGHQWQQGMSFLCFKHPEVLALMPQYQAYPPFNYANIGPIEYYVAEGAPGQPNAFDFQKVRPIHGAMTGSPGGTYILSDRFKRFIDGGGMHFGNHYDNDYRHVGPNYIANGYASIPPQMCCAGGSQWGTINTYGPTLEIMTSNVVGGWAQSFCAFTLAGYATVIWSYDWKMNQWDVRRYLRMGSTNYPNWSETKGFGYFHVNLHGLTAYNSADTAPNFGPTPFTKSDVASMMDSIVSHEASPVEPPVGIQVNCLYFDYDTWGYGAYGLYPPPGDFVANPQTVRGYPDGYYSQFLDELALAYPPYIRPPMTLENDPSRVDIRWVNFKSKNWKSTVITVNDESIYEGQDERFIWPVTTDRPITMRFYSRAINGELSKELDCVKFEFTKLRSEFKFGKGSKSVINKRKLWIPPK